MFRKYTIQYNEHYPAFQLNHTNLEKLPAVGFTKRLSFSGSPQVKGLGILKKIY